MSIIHVINDLEQFPTIHQEKPSPKHHNCCTQLAKLLKKIFSCCVCNSSNNDEVQSFDRTSESCPFEPSNDPRFEKAQIYEDRGWEYSLDNRWEAAGEETTS